jgi:hypothetical protein
VDTFSILMEDHSVETRAARPGTAQVFAWVVWVAFLLFSLGSCLFAEAEKRDVYFVRHYQHFTMDSLTIVVTRYPFWMAILPLLWLPFVIAYQRKTRPSGRTLLVLGATMIFAAVTLAALLLCAGPPLQM